jgi:hypothetical protein
VGAGRPAAPLQAWRVRVLSKASSRLRGRRLYIDPCDHFDIPAPPVLKAGAMLRRVAETVVWHARSGTSAAVLQALGGAGSAALQPGVLSGALAAPYSGAAQQPAAPSAGFSTSASPALAFGGRGASGPGPLTPVRPPRNLGITIVPERTGAFDTVCCTHACFAA